jgi:hypothetical protein
VAASADDAERAAIAAERSTIEARYAERERECAQRFVVTSCVDEAKRERRLGLDALKARQLALDEARRRARTAERSAELAAKAAEDAKRERAVPVPAASAPRPEGMPRAATPGDSAASTGKRLVLPPDHRRAASAAAAQPSAGLSPEARQANEARNRAAFEARQRHAAEHREEALDNAARRMTEKPPARSLPVPPPASAASS